jgi:hypothetical protein
MLMLLYFHYTIISSSPQPSTATKFIDVDYEWLFDVVTYQIEGKIATENHRGLEGPKFVYFDVR